MKDEMRSVKKKKDNSIGTIVDRFSSVRVLVVGDVLLDRFQYGKVERISPEAPVPVFCPARTVEMPGGAGNTAMNLSCLGCCVQLVARTGRDKMSKRLGDILDDNGVDTTFFHQDNRCTAVKTRLIAGNNHVMRIDEEQVAELDEKLTVLVADIVEEKIEECDIVVLSDYGKGFLSSKLTEKIIGCCRMAGKPVVVDPKGRDYRKYVGATLVKPNLKEFSDVSGKRFNPVGEGFQKELIRAAGDFLARCNIGGLLITLGEHGMLYVPSRKSATESIYLPTRAREVFDVSGAGDTTIAALAAAMGVGASMADAMQLANVAAGIVVGKLGTASVSAEELNSALSNAGGSPRRKIVSVDELQREVARLKKQGKKIGFTNGCFDCCHLGHLTSLREARKLCDVLVVGVNSDAWIRANKGPGRPIQDEATRTALLAELECVDFVVVFDDRTAMPLVRKLRPNVIAKEGYALKDWPEGRFVKSIGGEAIALKRVDGYSTTALAERMKVS